MTLPGKTPSVIIECGDDDRQYLRSLNRTCNDVPAFGFEVASLVLNAMNAVLLDPTKSRWRVELVILPQLINRHKVDAPEFRKGQWTRFLKLLADAQPEPP